MGRVTFEISVSADGYVAGPRSGREVPLGEGGERLHEWVVGLGHGASRTAWRAGRTTRTRTCCGSPFDAAGAHVMGRRMFSGDGGTWGDEPFEGWWGDEPPFHAPVFVVTHHPREPLVKDGGTTFTFVTDGVEAAVEQARARRGREGRRDRRRRRRRSAGARRGLVDEMQLHVVPLLLGGGVRLFEELPAAPVTLEQVRVLFLAGGDPMLRYRVPDRAT